MSDFAGKKRFLMKKSFFTIYINYNIGTFVSAEYERDDISVFVVETE